LDFKNPDSDSHGQMVLDLNPKYATVLDVTAAGQLGSALKQADVFHEYGISPIIIPKIDCISDIPKDFILGFSIPTPYGGTQLSPEQFANRKVHLLGGTPKQQLQYYIRMQKMECTITSTDGNAASKAAAYGTIWQDRFGHEWTYKYKGVRGSVYYQALEESLRNIWDFWQAVLADSRRGQLTLW